MQTLTVLNLAELRAGDTLVAVDGRRRRRPLTVRDPLGAIEDGSPVMGVRFENPFSTRFDFVFYPSQMDGCAMEILRPGEGCP